MYSIARDYPHIKAVSVARGATHLAKDGRVTTSPVDAIRYFGVTDKHAPVVTDFVINVYLHEKVKKEDLASDHYPLW